MAATWSNWAIEFACCGGFIGNESICWEVPVLIRLLSRVRSSCFRFVKSDVRASGDVWSLDVIVMSLSFDFRSRGNLWNRITWNECAHLDVDVGGFPVVVGHKEQEECIHLRDRACRCSCAWVQSLGPKVVYIHEYYSKYSEHIVRAIAKLLSSFDLK